MTDEAKALVERLRGGWNGWTTLTEIEAADLIETQAREIERLRDTPHRIWAEARDSEWDEGFNYAVKLFRAALAGDSNDQ